MMNKKENTKYTFWVIIALLMFLVSVFGYYVGLIEGKKLHKAESVTDNTMSVISLPKAKEQKPFDDPIFRVKAQKVNTEEITPETDSEEENEPTFKALDIPLDADVQEFIYSLAEEYDIPFGIVIALIETESGFDHNAYSSTNDSGLMQINGCNHSWLSSTLGISNFFDPYENVQAGMYMLNNLFDKYEDPHMVLMAYNYGEGGASSFWNDGIYSSTYSEKIVARAEDFERMLEVL